MAIKSQVRLNTHSYLSQTIQLLTDILWFAHPIFLKRIRHATLISLNRYSTLEFIEGLIMGQIRLGV